MMRSIKFPIYIPVMYLVDYIAEGMCCGVTVLCIWTEWWTCDGGPDSQSSQLLWNMNDDKFALTVQLSLLIVVKYVQGDSVGMVNILGGDNIGHCEEKKCTWTVSTSEWCADIQLVERTDNTALGVLLKKEKLLAVNL